MVNTEPNSLEYFAGGVPTGEYFRFTLNDLSSVIDRSSSEQGVNRLNEVCFIGLVSYFEAFCKDHFASILNIEPTLLEAVLEKPDQVVPARGAAKACQSKCEIDGRIFLLRVIVDDSVDPAVVVTAYRTTKIEKYWGKP